MNATTHGILSRRLLLTGEDPAEYQALLTDLRKTLRPAGALEAALVEKVAVAIWRQKRLVAAEAATIELSRAPDDDILADTLNLLGRRPPSKEAEAWRHTKLSAPIANELMMRYQIALDGELYRAIEALRKQQEWRLRAGIQIEAEDAQVTYLSA